MANSIATAYVQVIPTTDGIREKLAEEFSKTGEKSAESYSQNFSNKIAGLAKTVGVTAAIAGVAAIGVTMAAGFSRLVAIDDAKFKLAGLGLTATDVSGVMDSALAAVKGTAFGLGEAATIAASAIAAGIKPGIELEKYLRLTADAAAIAGTSLDEMGGLMNNVRTVGVAYNDSLQQLAQKGIPIYQWLSEELGITTQDVKDLAAEGGISALQFESAIEKHIGGAALTTGQSLSGSFDNMMAAVGRLGAAMLGSSVDEFPAIIENITNAIDDVTPVMQEFATGAVEAIKTAFTWISENGNLVVPILAGIAGVIVAALVPAMWAAVTATWALTVAMLANPFTWIIIAIGALIGAIVFLIMNWEAVVQFFDDVFGPAIQAVGDMFTWLWENGIKPVIDFVVAAFTNMYENFIRPIFLGVMLYIGLWAALFEWLYEYAIKPALNAIGEMFEWLYQNAIQPVINFVIGMLESLGRVFTWLYNNIVKPVFDGVASAFTWLWTYGIKPVIKFITDAIEGIGSTTSNVFGAIGGFIKSVFDGIVNIIRGPVNAVIGFINTLIGGLNKIRIDIPDWVPEWGGKTIGFNIAKIPMLADGGTLTGSGTVMVGERGPELLTLPKGAQVTPLDRAGGNTIVYNAAPNQSIDAEQALFAAMRRSKLVAGWS